MRAFLSDLAERDGWSYFTWLDFQSAREESTAEWRARFYEFKSESAVAEARAILRETERGIWSWPGVPADYAVRDMAQAALAEALTAFVADEWQCTGSCGTIRYASLMSGRGGLRACPACGSLAERA